MRRSSDQGAEVFRPRLRGSRSSSLDWRPWSEPIDIDIYIYTYVRMYVCVHACMYFCMVSKLIFICVSIFTHVDMDTDADTHIIGIDIDTHRNTDIDRCAYGLR